MITADEKKGDSYKLLVEGTDYQSVMATMGIDGRRTYFNNALTVAEASWFRFATVISAI